MAREREVGWRDDRGRGRVFGRGRGRGQVVRNPDIVDAPSLPFTFYKLSLPAHQTKYKGLHDQIKRLEDILAVQGDRSSDIKQLDYVNDSVKGMFEQLEGVLQQLCENNKLGQVYNGTFGHCLKLIMNALRDADPTDRTILHEHGRSWINATYLHNSSKHLAIMIDVPTLRIIMDGLRSLVNFCFYPAPMVSFLAKSCPPNVSLSSSNRIAVKTGECGWNTNLLASQSASIDGEITYRVSYPSSCGDFDGRSVMCGFAPSSLISTAVAAYTTCGWYLFFEDGACYSQSGDDCRPLLRRSISANEEVICVYNSKKQTISYAAPGQDLHIAFTNVQGDLFPAILLRNTNSTVLLR